MSDTIKQEDWIYAKERFMPKSKLEPKLDEPISKIVGKRILQLDPRLIRLITKWKVAKKDPDTPDNFLEDPKKIIELKKVMNASL